MANLIEGAVQVQRPYGDLSAGHLVSVIGLSFILGFGIQQHTGHLVGCPIFGDLILLIFHIGEYLVYVAGMNGLPIIMRLHSMLIVFGVYNEHRGLRLEDNIALHDR